jgi:hypothetical protein
MTREEAVAYGLEGEAAPIVGLVHPDTDTTGYSSVSVTPQP